MNLENIILSKMSEISRSQNAVGFRLHKVLRVVKTIETKENGSYRRLVGGRNAGLLFNGYRVSVLQEKKRVMEMDGGDGSRMGMYLIPVNLK